MSGLILMNRIQNEDIRKVFEVDNIEEMRKENLDGLDMCKNGILVNQ